MDDTQTADRPDVRRKDKVRSAWISFAGRIVAQLVGAIATVALGVMVLHRYTSTRPPAATPAPTAYGQPVATAAAPAPPVQIILTWPEMVALRDADQRFRPADRSCAPGLDAPPASATHFDGGPLLSR
jgi:hypothetical protein